MRPYLLPAVAAAALSLAALTPDRAQAQIMAYPSITGSYVTPISYSYPGYSYGYMYNYPGYSTYSYGWANPYSTWNWSSYRTYPYYAGYRSGPRWGWRGWRRW